MRRPTRQYLEAPALAEVDLRVVRLALLVDPPEGVARVAVLERVSLWNTTVAHQDHDLVNRLWVL